MGSSTATISCEKKQEAQDWLVEVVSAGQCYSGGQVPSTQERSRSRGQFQGTLRPSGANGKKQALCQLTPAPSVGALPVLVGGKESVVLFDVVVVKHGIHHIALVASPATLHHTRSAWHGERHVVPMLCSCTSACQTDLQPPQAQGLYPQLNPLEALSVLEKQRAGITSLGLM